eukprot:1923369-Pleurochrysis_carterae.AAC.2
MYMMFLAVGQEKRIHCLGTDVTQNTLNKLFARCDAGCSASSAAREPSEVALPASQQPQPPSQPSLQPASQPLLQPKQPSQSQRATFYYIDESVWARLRTYAAAPRTPDFPQRLKTYVMTEAKLWLTFIINNLAPADIRVFIIELHKDLFPLRTLVLNNARDVAVKLRVLYVMREFQAQQPAASQTRTIAQKSWASHVSKVPLRELVVEGIDKETNKPKDSSPIKLEIAPPMQKD